MIIQMLQLKKLTRNVLVKSKYFQSSILCSCQVNFVKFDRKVLTTKIQFRFVLSKLLLTPIPLCPPFRILVGQCS
jgi:hypothetical protein